MKILLTGITGFVGSSLLESFPDTDVELVALTRKIVPIENVKQYQIESYNGNHDWKAIFSDVDVVIHLAAKAHIQCANADEFYQANVEMTEKLVEIALENEVKKFIFTSSIGVIGDRTNGVPFNEETILKPHSAYATSKLQAERRIKSLVAGANMSFVIIRPPLIYGKRAPGNIATILKLIKSSIPLPFKGIRNKRSFIHIDNLVKVIHEVVMNDKYNNKTIHCADNIDLSTPDFFRVIAKINDEKLNMIWFFPKFIQFVVSITGKKRMKNSLFMDLQVKNSKELEDVKLPFHPREFLEK